MKERERVFATMKHEPVDRIPYYSTIYFARETVFGQATMEEHLRFSQEISPDIQKAINKHLVPNIGSIKTVEDWRCIRTITFKDKSMGGKIEPVKRILDRYDRNAFDIGALHGIVAPTVHSIEPDHDYVPVRQLLCSRLRQNRDPVLDAMKRIADELYQLAGKFVELGLDGILYAGLGGERLLFTDQESGKYIIPLDKQIMKAYLEAGGHNILHMCEADVNFDRYGNYRGLYSIANWGIYETGMSPVRGRKRFADCVATGGLLSHKGPLIEGTPDEIRQEVRHIMAEAGETGFILGADYTIPMGMPYERIQIAVEAIEQGPDREKSMEILTES